jgi:hypothetical protein
MKLTTKGERWLDVTIATLAVLASAAIIITALHLGGYA